MTLKLAIIGRPNVGKSTLFNRLTRSRHALVDDTPGVTRDRREGAAEIAGLEFTVIDTAGLEEKPEKALQSRMQQQTMRAVDDADVILFVVDCRAGIMPEDRLFAQASRASGKPVILIINKAEGRTGTDAAADAYSLGFENMVAISAEHGEGTGALYDEILSHILPTIKEEEEVWEEETDEEETRDRGPLQIAIVGRPNAGKSTLINTMLGEDRLLTGPEAGITRDAIAVEYTYNGETYKLVDTAGIRKKANVQEKLEKLAVHDALRTIQFAQVVVLLMDATHPFEKQDMQLASLIEQEGRACVLAVNKWDLVTNHKLGLEEARYQVDQHIPFFKGIPIVPLTGQTGEGVDHLMKAIQKMYKVWNKKISTADLNRWLEDATSRNTPPLVNGKRVRLKYATQVKIRPPTFSFFVNYIDKLPDSYRRFLVNDIREWFDMPGVPIRIMLKKGKNPYEGKAKKK